MVPIEELVVTTPSVATFDDERVVFRRVSQVIATGVRPVLRLRTVEGFELRLTEDHRVSTEDGDVPAGALQPGDRIRLLAPAAPESVPRDSADARFGEVIGWLVGDGHFTTHARGKRTAVLSFDGEDKLLR